MVNNNFHALLMGNPDYNNDGVSEAFFPTFTLTPSLMFSGHVFWYNQNGNHP